MKEFWINFWADICAALVGTLVYGLYALNRERRWRWSFMRRVRLRGWVTEHLSSHNEVWCQRAQRDNWVRTCKPDSDRPGYVNVFPADELSHHMMTGNEFLASPRFPLWVYAWVLPFRPLPNLAKSRQG